MTGRRVAMVTGATGGLGRVLVPDLASDGWDLVLVGSSQERLDGLLAATGLDAEQVATIEANLREQAAATAAVDAAPPLGTQRLLRTRLAVPSCAQGHTMRIPSLPHLALAGATVDDPLLDQEATPEIV